MPRCATLWTEKGKSDRGKGKGSSGEAKRETPTGQGGERLLKMFPKRELPSVKPNFGVGEEVWMGF